MKEFQIKTLPHVWLILCLAIVRAAGADEGNFLRLPVTRDNWFSEVGREANANLGGAPQLKLKSIQEMSLVDIDPTPLKGHVIRSAVLHVRRRGEEVLHRVTVSTFAADWVEGTSASYEPKKGSSCFNFQRYPDVPWAYPGSDLTAVMLAQGGTIWRSVDATAPDAQGWMTINVDPVLVEARVAGISQGFLLFDDTGSEWTRDGEKFKLRLFPNRFIYSRDSNRASAPYFTIELGPEHHEPPETPIHMQSRVDDLPAGEADVSWMTPPDRDRDGVPAVGFVVELNGRRVPQYLVPAAVAGQRVFMHLRDLGLKRGQTARFVVRAVDGAGNVGEPAGIQVKVSDSLPKPLPGVDLQPFVDGGPLPKLAGGQVAIIDTLDKVLPETEKMIPPQEPGYLSANHLWSAKEKRIRLRAARNEFVSFQILLRGPLKDVSPTVDFSGDIKPQVDFSVLGNIPSKAGPVPDPLLPLKGSYSVPANAKTGSLLCELYIPHDMPPGAHRGFLTLSSGADRLKLAIDLSVWDFTLPDHLSFIPELNCYDLPSNELDYYRLAHRNRTVIDRVPYYQTGIVADRCAPTWDGHHLDWTAWDRRFAKYFDGSAFKDLPRKDVPLGIFYLPLNENWPSPMAGNYNGSYWADQAFPAAYRQTFVEVSRQFAEHFNQK
ncbi:MAG TPA: hypothetical protein VN541_18545, partial [Tepidisphaeraceae bacterium]|nr:hypothetical protein [Tepidisphaeraceae bacterium]